MAGEQVTFRQGDTIFIPDEREITDDNGNKILVGDKYVPGYVADDFVQGEPGRVRVNQEGAVQNLSKKESMLVERRSVESSKAVSDMITLSLLNNASLLHNLRMRYHGEGLPPGQEGKMTIYTNIGSILVSINPYKDLGLYDAEVEDRYLNSGGNVVDLPPHVFKVAESAFQMMRHQDKDQSAVITGESGAGKTEATKRFLQYICEKSRRNREGSDEATHGVDTDNLRMKILDSNPFMEAFGNAKTVRNDNSSRFGKFIELYFQAKHGVLAGAKITNYLLEKSRVVRVSKGERNYHIFYQLCDTAANSSTDFKKKYHLKTADQFKYCMGDNKTLRDVKVDDVTDNVIFEETKEAMKKMGMTDDELDMTWRVCAGILHLGNIEFTGSDSAGMDQNTRSTSLQHAADMFGLEVNALAEGILRRKLLGDVVKDHTKREAEAARDALAKHVYNKLFDWLIRKINSSLGAGELTGGKKRMIGVLDIFGFETFAVNSFEQMCINFCNEKLQSFFNEHVFRREQQLYKKEGINAKDVGFYDNEGVVKTIEGKATSVMVICDDQCWLESATDKSFLQKVFSTGKAAQMSDKDAHKKYLFRPKVQDIRKRPHLDRAFVIKHFAGFVEYTVDGFLEKNKDQLRKDLREVFGTSDMEVVSKFFPPESQNAGRKKEFRSTLGSKFATSLNRLMKQLDKTTPQFVRTIKPNETKRPGDFDAHKIFKQLREAGLLEVCRIRKLGYPIRKSHKEFYSEYLCLDKSAKDVTDLCNKLKEKGILTSTKEESPNWQVGKTLVFLRVEQANTLERLRSEALKEVLKLVQGTAKRFVFRTRVRMAVQATRQINKGILKKDPEMLHEGLNFFLSKGPMYTELPIVMKGKAMMKDLQAQLDILAEISQALNQEDVATLRVKLEVADSMGLSDKSVVVAARDFLENVVVKKKVKETLTRAMGGQIVGELKEALAYAESKKHTDIPEYKQATTMLATLEEREMLLNQLREAVKNEASEDEIMDLIVKLQANNADMDDPIIQEAIKFKDLVVEQNKKREQRIAMLKKQLTKALDRKNLTKLIDLISVAVKLKFNGPQLKDAVNMVRALQDRQDLLDEVTNASRVLKEKSKMPDGIVDKDLQPLKYAIRKAKEVEELNLGNEVQVKQGEKLLKDMSEQLIVQQEIEHLVKETGDDQFSDINGYLAALEKIQKLGMQTKNADHICQVVREHELLSAKANALTNHQESEALKITLHVPTKDERMAHLLARIDKMYSKKFAKQHIAARNSRELTLESYYKVRSNADFVSKEPRNQRQRKKELKFAYIGIPITKSMLELDDFQEKKALDINKTICRFCDGLSGNRRDVLESDMRFIVEHGICDELLGDEIYMQLAKHLTANHNALSKNKGWYLMCLCSTYFNCSKRFLPYFLHFLANSVSDAGLEGNYARYTMGQMSASLEIDCRDVRFTPSSEELKAFFSRPPVLAELELLDGKLVNIPIPPDFSLRDALPIIRRKTKSMVALDNPEWSVYIKATAKPPKLSYKQRLINFYRKYKPENIANVDGILQYYKGQEESLFNELTSTANYGPEPTPVIVGPAKKKKRRGRKSSSASGRMSRSDSEMAESMLDDMETTSQFSTMSKSTIGSAISKVGSTISRLFRRARGLSTVDMLDMDAINPTVAWPLPWWCHLGDIMHALFEQDKIPILTYRLNTLKTKGTPSNEAILQLQKDFLDGTLMPTTNTHMARLATFVLAMRLARLNKLENLKNNKKFQEGVLKCIPRPTRKAWRKNKTALNDFLEVCYKERDEVQEFRSLKALQKQFFAECLQVPSFGMSFFFAHVLKSGDLQSSLVENEDDMGASGGLKIGVSQHRMGFFNGNTLLTAIPVSDITTFWCDGMTFSMKVKKGSGLGNDSQSFDMQLASRDQIVRQDSRVHPPLKPFKKQGGVMKTLRKLRNAVLGERTFTVQLYTLQPRELYDIVYQMKHH